MTPRDLPETATPWTDKLGNVWCVVFPGDSETWVNVYLLLPEYPKWQTIETVRVYLVNADLLAGLGRTLPPVPTTKRVAKAFKVQNPTLPEEHRKEYAASDNVLYCRFPGERRWEKSPPIDNSYHIAAAHMAFQHAGDVLPGEEASDA